MDYPKSVPSIGLVDGRFVDENPVAGTPGSLIPAVWGNSVTEELLGVIKAAGMTPAEGINDQLLSAFKKLLSLASPMTSRVTEVSASKALIADELGLVLISANTADTTITLPAVSTLAGVRDVIVRRTDNSANRLVVQAAGNDRIRFHTHLSASGYPFLVLVGAGDWWHLRSDGSGNWWPVGRFDATPLGRIVFESSTTLNPGGYGALNGREFLRAEWPWLWDHAVQSGMLRAEASRAGGWSSGDGIKTFRGPEVRGEFIRVLDEQRNIDTGRVAGSWQSGTNITGDNGYAPAIHGIGDISTIGVDPTTFGGLVYYSTAAVAEPLSSGFWGMTRPRNVAYPGRLKLI
ncbi:MULTISPECIES: phage tail protein [unclassified Pseudomonas]|uniref:phage tail protein n=1 Tax=unclassified Pseudomonas TaxID=196821 RepID=UPI000A1FC2F8|nr:MULTISPECIES: phage tail protein [unclassified Pseudomonas]MDI2141744.1 phage tail protein [Pseudomonas sp. ITA]